MSKRIAVLGAGGHTGRFVVDLLRRQGAVAIPATRSGVFAAIGGATESCHRLDFQSPDSLDPALAGADAAINCAGPFFHTAAPAVAACLRAGIPYFDVTAEQETVRQLFERFDDPARARGITIVPAMAFFGGLADLLASGLAAGLPHIDTIDVAVGLDFWHPTRGTRLTGDQNNFPRLIVRAGEQVPAAEVAPPDRHWAFPPPIGGQVVTCVALSEVILMSRHLTATAITSYMNRKPIADITDPRVPPPQAVDPRGRSAQRFAVEVVVTADGRSRRATASGVDIYAVTAPLVVAACHAVLNQVAAPSGVRAPGELFDARSFLAALAPDIVVDFADPG